MRKLSVPIVIAWIGLAVFLNTSTPQLEKVGELRSVSMSPKGAPALHRFEIAQHPPPDALSGMNAA
jgi:uncharacterized membrane protein YdfJ with MMPL/SSD domain